MYSYSFFMGIESFIFQIFIANPDRFDHAMSIAKELGYFKKYLI